MEPSDPQRDLQQVRSNPALDYDRLAPVLDGVVLEIPNWLWTAAICLLLVALPLAAFWPVMHADFINFDDPGGSPTENPHVKEG